MRDVIVLGERCTDIADELLGLDFAFRPGGMAEFSGRVSEDGPLIRAIFRAEAELLLDDATAMAAGRYEFRTPEQRRADAFVLIAERIGTAAASMAPKPAARQDRHGMGATDHKRRSL